MQRGQLRLLHAVITALSSPPSQTALFYTPGVVADLRGCGRPVGGSVVSSRGASSRLGQGQPASALRYPSRSVLDKPGLEPHTLVALHCESLAFDCGAAAQLAPDAAGQGG